MTSLDDICWITNLRGTDIKFNPVFFAYALFYPKRAAGTEPRIVIFTNNLEANSQAEYLSSQNIEVRPYDQITDQLIEYNSTGVKVGVTTETCNAELHRICKDVAVKTENTIKNTKCAKNATEMKGMRDCNVRDCAAIMKYFAFLEEELRKSDHTLTEYTGACILDDIRTQGQHH